MRSNLLINNGCRNFRMGENFEFFDFFEGIGQTFMLFAAIGELLEHQGMECQKFFDKMHCRKRDSHVNRFINRDDMIFET